MGMVVRSNIMAYNANRQLGMNNSAVSKNLEKLSSGFKINRAGDDASGLAISEKMKAQITGLETASLNAQDGISLVQTAEGALTEVHDMLKRMVELATRSATGTLQDSVDREAIKAEVTALGAEIDRVAEATNFNDINVLQEGAIILQIGEKGETYNQIKVTLSGMNSSQIGLAGVDDAVADSSTAAAQISIIKDAINTVSTQRAAFGALQNRLEHTINNLDTTAENMTAANSRLRDTDMAKQMMEYTKMNVLTQAAQAMLAQANQQPQSVLQLLQ